jgi:hypothetical protein
MECGRSARGVSHSFLSVGDYKQTDTSKLGSPASTMFPDTANVSIVAFIFAIVVVVVLLLLFTAEQTVDVTHDCVCYW